MPDKLTDIDFENAAKLLYCEVACVKAVAEIESGGNGFLSTGEIKILFEGHVFYKYTKGKFANSHPTICYPKWTTEYYTKSMNPDVRGKGELTRLTEAMSLDRQAALLSASYGKFQIMGFNYMLCGYKSVEDFYTAMQVSEGKQLEAFCEYIKATDLDDDLRGKRWVDFARRYNGPGYQRNKYDLKLAAAYARYS